MEETKTTQPKESIMKEFASEPKKSTLKEILLPAGVILAIILAGSATGYILAKRGIKIGPTQIKKLTGGAEMVEGPREMGIKDEKAFPDTSQGKLEVNSNSNVSEGSHKLVRPGGVSQTIYLTSTAVDLNQFTGKCVQIWGQTFAAQKAGWLMDVGRIKLLDNCPEGI